MSINSSVVVNVTATESSSWDDDQFVEYVTDRLSTNVAEAIRKIADE